MSLEITFISLFPGRIQYYLSHSLVGKAIASEKLKVNFIQLRDFGLGAQNQVDDYPYSKQSGMLLRVDVLSAAIRSIQGYSSAKIIYLDPKGQSLSQAWLKAESKMDQHLILISGFYEGVDARIFDLFDIQRISIGDYVLSCGDLPALVLAESLIRLLPGYVINKEPICNDSFYDSGLEANLYTRPALYEGLAVPDYLVSGHHAKIEDLNLQQAIKNTLLFKPKLLLQNLPNGDKLISADLLEEMSQSESNNTKH